MNDRRTFRPYRLCGFDVSSLSFSKKLELSTILTYPGVASISCYKILVEGNSKLAYLCPSSGLRRIYPPKACCLQNMTGPRQQSLPRYLVQCGSPRAKISLILLRRGYKYLFKLTVITGRTARRGSTWIQRGHTTTQAVQHNPIEETPTKPLRLWAILARKNCMEAAFCYCPRIAVLVR